MSNRECPTADQELPESAASASEPADEACWPPEARLILSALEAGEGAHNENRREQSRALYQVRASLRLFSDSEGSPPWRLYTRDVTARSVGFITPHRLPLGYGGIVELTDPHGKAIRAHCTLFRCRQTAGGWFEGALSFHRPQWSLSDEEPAEQKDAV